MKELKLDLNSDLSDNMKAYLEMIEWTKKAFEKILIMPKEMFDLKKIKKNGIL